MVKNIIVLVEILTCLYGIAATFGLKMKYNIWAVILIITEMILLTGINQYGLPAYLVSLSYLLIFVYCLLNYRESLIKTIVSCVIAVAVIGITQVICYIPTSFVVSDESVIIDLVVSVMSLIVIILLGNRIKLKELSDFLLKKKILSIGIVFSVCVALGIQLWKIKENGIVYGKDYIPIMYFICLILVILREWQKSKVDAEKEKAQLQMNILYYDAYKELIKSVREKQHDLKNHINAICGMIYTIDNYEDLIAKQKEYINKVLGKVERVPVLTLVENPLLSGFLIQKIHESESYGIDVEQNCIFVEKELKIPEYKLVEMMGILFDNAIEETIQRDYDKKIYVQLSNENNTFYFSISNICKEKIQDTTQLFIEGYSKKGRNRGIGLPKLKRIVEQENGEVSIEQKELYAGCVMITFGIQIFDIAY